MRGKNTKKDLEIINRTVENNFTNERLTHYSGLGTIWDYVRSNGLIGLLNRTFPTIVHNALKFSNIQIIMSIVLGHMCGVHRLVRLENFTKDPLVRHLLALSDRIEDSTFKDRLLKLGKGGATLLQESLFSLTSKWLCKMNLSRITIDCDSTVSTVYGNQEGAAKGYNPYKKGALSYHPLLCYCSEMKLLINSWFRTGSVYTSNGICEFLSQTLAMLPKHVKKIFFRADTCTVYEVRGSGFFNGALFDLLEDGGHEYLVKVKLKNLSDLMKKQTWTQVNSKVSVCEFDYRAKDWKASRKLKALRMVKSVETHVILGSEYRTEKFEYFCYCSNLKGLSVCDLHSLYGARAESENWIEQTKNQLHASQTVTDDFHVNDTAYFVHSTSILWQLAVLGYNLSVIMRYEADHKIWKQEHLTFLRWFINVPGKVIKSARKVVVKMSAHYWEANNWQRFAAIVTSSA